MLRVNFSTATYYDIRVGQAFVQAWRSLKTGNTRRENEAAAEVTDLIRRIFGHDRLEINASEDGQTIQVLIDGRSYGLHELGSGFTQFVLVLINAAVQKPSFVLIDEPELGLHATLQLQFLTTLGSFAKEGVLFATHSIGLARAAGELVYSLTRQGSGASKIQELGSEPRLSELLGELSFSGY
jgi:predicted ATPase